MATAQWYASLAFAVCSLIFFIVVLNSNVYMYLLFDALQLRKESWEFQLVLNFERYRKSAARNYSMKVLLGEIPEIFTSIAF
jgi:hypothetical protein